ncbi:MAG: nitronate monooxygenase family protein [Rikenellaceae bacterium]
MKSFKIGNLEINLPIVQGGMGVGVSLSGLASAVANEGGVGVISAAGLGVIYKEYSKDFNEACIYGLKEEIRKAREATTKGVGAIGVNIMVVLTNFADMVKTAVAEKADVIFAGAGLPLSLPSFLESDSVTKIVPIVSSARAAKVLCEKWFANYNYVPDAIVVEGPKAGGHLGFSAEQLHDEEYSLESILPQVVATVREFEVLHNRSIPVIAGGGVYTGADIKKILDLGASAVQMGTRFVVTEECDADVTFKQMYIDAKEEDIEIIQSPVGMPGRAVHNDFLAKVHSGEKHPKSCPFNCIKTCKVEKSPYCIMMALFNAYKGRMDRGYAFSGSNGWRSERIMKVKELVDSLKAEYEVAVG